MKRFLLALLILACLLDAQAQTIVTPPSAQLTNQGFPGAVLAIVRDSTGRTIVGGVFDHAGSTARSNLARFNADGTLDLSWNPAPNGVVQALALDLSGNVYVGGSFTTIGSQSRMNLARVSANSGLADAAWMPFTLGTVRTMALDGSGSLFAGGQGLFKVSTSGAGDPDFAWTPNPDGAIYSILPDGAGNLFVAGSFSSIGGKSRHSIAKIAMTGTGTADATWNPGMAGIAGYPYSVEAMVRDLSGHLFVGGNFTGMGGQTSLVYAAKLSTSGTGAADPAWTPLFSSWIRVMALDLSGNLFVGGDFLSVTGFWRNRLVKVSASGAGAVDPNWSADANGEVWSLALDGGGNICAGGSFGTIAGQARAAYACLSPTALPAAPQITSGNAAIFAVQTAGTFTVTATGNPAPTLSVSGTLPTGVQFNPSTGVLGGTPALGTVGGYPLTVTASNGVAPNATQSFTLTVTATVPGKPTITNVTSQSNQATVAFAAPSNDGGDPILFYTARCTNGATTQTNTGGGTPITVTGLTNNTQYSCTVAATNGKGEGPQSDPASVTPIDLGTLVFGGQSMGTTSPPKAVGFGLNVPVTVTAITVSAQFGQSNDCATVPANQTCTIQVTFSPTPVVGAVNASLPVTGTLTITSSNVGSFTVALSGIAEKSLVTHYYSSILRRAPDAGGKQFWINQATLMSSLGVNVNEAWYAMAQQFFSSAEYASFNRTNNGFITDLYVTFFNRAPDPGGLDFWVQQLTSGLPREVALAGFMFSAEFSGFTGNIFGNSSARAEVGVVMDFYRGLLSRLPDESGLNFWVQRFRAAQCKGAGFVYGEVEEISRQFANGGEYLGKNRTNAQYVGDLYNAFLRRGGDLGGVNSWINFLVTPPNLGTGEQPGTARERVRRQFIASGEFQARVNAIVNQGCQPQ